MLSATRPKGALPGSQCSGTWQSAAEWTKGRADHGVAKRVVDRGRRGLLTGQPILQNRLQGVGPLDAATAIGLGVTGPLLRSTGVAWDLRRDQPGCQLH